MPDKQDIYKHEQRYKSWKESVLKFGESDLTKKNSDLLLQYIFDMEIGNNTSSKSKKGARTFHRLNAVRQKVSMVFRMLQKRNVLDISKVSEKDLQQLFTDMRNGTLLSDNGKPYISTPDYVKGFKAFWHWYQKAQMKKGKVIPDITEYLDSTSTEKPKWVYLNETQIDILMKQISPRYHAFFSFLYDSGSRVTEALSLRVSDIEERQGSVFVNIRPEISKSIGRKIKLMLCNKEILEYIKENKLKPEDLLFPITPAYLNRYLGEKCKEVLGEAVSQGGEKYSKMTLYDFRHNSCCYWLQRYKKNSELQYRFGWKSEKYIHYYSEFLGLKDTISDEDMLIDVTKTQLEREISKLKRDKAKDKAESIKTLEEFKKFKQDFNKFQELLTSNPEVVKLLNKDIIKAK